MLTQKQFVAKLNAGNGGKRTHWEKYKTLFDRHIVQNKK